MAEHNWRELLDDPEILVLVTKLVNGPGARRYDPRGKDAMIFDELECWAWDRAVDLAIAFPGESKPLGDPERRNWYAFLWKSLTTAIPWLWREFAGEPESAKRRAWTAGIQSVEVITDTYESGEAAPIESQVNHADPFWWHRVTAADPLGVILRRERLEAMLRAAEYRARHGAFVTETHPDVLCREPMCRDLARSLGYCGRHYERQRALWGKADGSSPTCRVDGCPSVVYSRGLCESHYSAESHRRRRDGDPWPEITRDRRECTVDGCDREHEAQGLCAQHYAEQREATAPPCTECDRPAFTKGLCRRCYKRSRRAQGLAS